MPWPDAEMRTRIGMQNGARPRNRRHRGIRNFSVIAAGLVLAGCGGEGGAAASTVTLATTHTIEDTGLLDALSAAFAQAHPDIALRIVVAGSGEALAYGRRGDADVLLTHAPEDEERFVAEGYGARRVPIMRNEFVVYGPAADPAGVRGTRDAAEAFRGIMERRAGFVSRGDDSGTHKRERAIWAAIGVEPAGEWYEEAGVGQADALRIASERQAYILADRATFAVLEPALDLVPIAEGDARLVNTYSVIRATRSPHPAEAAVLEEWLTGDAVRELVRALGVDAHGRALFEPLPETTAADA